MQTAAKTTKKIKGSPAVAAPLPPEPAPVPATEKVEIKNRFTGAVMFTAEVELGLSTAGLKLGAAVKMAVKAGANLAGANLAGANLARANLAGAYLAGAYLAGANLAGANLAGANLAGAYLADADLARANLARANLADAYLAGANLAGANLARAKDLLDCGTPHGYRVVVNVFRGAIRIWAGCRSLSLTEARSHWKSRDARKLMPALLDYIESAAKTLGWPVI